MRQLVFFLEEASAAAMLEGSLAKDHPSRRGAPLHHV